VVAAVLDSRVPTEDFRLLQRYSDPLPIQSRASFHILSAVRLTDNQRCVVVLPGPRANRAKVAEVLAEVAAIHATLVHPLIPRVSALGEVDGTPFLEFDVPASRDSMDVTRCMAESGEKIPYDAADAFIVSLRQTLEVAHLATHPRHGGPVYLGRFSHNNVLFADDGRWWLIGLGRNFAVENEYGQFDGTTVAFHAPELGGGGAASQMGDYVAMVLFMRSLLPYAELAPRLARLFQGDVGPDDETFLDLLRWVEQRVLGELPATRATWQEAVTVAAQIREMMGTSIDQQRFVDFAAHCIALADEPASLQELDSRAPGESAVLSMDAEVTWLAGPDGQKQRVGSASRGIIRALAAQHRDRTGEPLTMWDLLEAGWPGQRPMPAAGANRVYVELNRLRKLGLRECIERFDAGYRLSPRLVVRVVDGQPGT
jgi:hypothetical protein